VENSTIKKTGIEESSEYIKFSPKIEDSSSELSYSVHYGLENWEWEIIEQRFDDDSCSEVHDYLNHGCRRYYKCMLCNGIGLENEFYKKISSKIGIHEKCGFQRNNPDGTQVSLFD